RVGGEDGVRCVAGPGVAVGAGGVTDRVGLVLVAAGVPHAELFRGVVPRHVGAHEGDLFPFGLRREDGLAVVDAGPGFAVGAGGVADGGAPVRLAGVPEVVDAVVALQDAGA